MKSCLSYPLAAFLFLIGISPAAFAQTDALVIASTTTDQDASPYTSRVYLLGDKMVLESDDEENEPVMMFDAGQETFYLINHKKKEYAEITREDMKAMKAMIEEQMANVEQQLAMLPEKQREMVREQMNAAFGEEQEPAEYALEESGIEIKDWETDKYIGTFDGQKQNEVYIASYSELGKSKADFAILETFSNLMKDYTQGMSSYGFDAFNENMPGFDKGLPVKTVLYDETGNAISTTIIESIGKEAVAEEVFIIPEDYKKQKLGRMGME